VSERHPIIVPRENVNDDAVIFVRWLVPDHAPVKAGDSIAEIETSKAVVVLEAEGAGYLVQTARANDEIPVGGELGFVAVELTESAASVRIEPVATALAQGQTFSKRAQALIEQHGIDRALFVGKSLVRELDVVPFIGQPPKPVAQRAGSERSEGPRRGRAKVAESVALTPTKRTEIRYLKEGTGDALLSAVTVLVRTTGLDARIAEAAQARRMSYLDFVIAAAARELRVHRELNAFLSEDHIHYYSDVNVGVAFNLGKGLMVPVITEADRKSADEISRQNADLAMCYLRGELTERHLVGGTFTVTDLSGAGAFQVLPLINREQSAILAMGHDHESLPGIMSLTLSFDHRVSEGLQATEFLRGIKGAIEEEAPASHTVSPTLACSNCFVTLERLERDGMATFLVPIVRRDGSQGYCCRMCLAGWNA